MCFFIQIFSAKHYSKNKWYNFYNYNEGKIFYSVNESLPYRTNPNANCKSDYPAAGTFLREKFLDFVLNCMVMVKFSTIYEMLRTSKRVIFFHFFKLIFEYSL